MATIVQPYNDWRERAAVNILGPIITGLLNRHFESEDNRKRNALMGQVISDLHATQEQPVMQTAPAMPEGYNANGWASAFHQNENPVANYDIATTGLVPIQSLQRNPNIQEIQDALIRNMATRRFGGVSPQVAQADMTPYIQAAEQDRRERMRNDVATSYANATDAAGRRDAIMEGIIRGTLPESMGATALQHNPFPEGVTYNDGEAMNFYNRDPQTGLMTEVQRVMNRQTPQQIAENDYKDRELAQKNSQFWGNLGEKSREFDDTHALATRQQNFVEDSTMYERNNPKLEQIIARDGTGYLINPRTGNVTEIKTPDGKSIKINPKTSDVILKEDGNGNYVAVDRNSGTAYTVTDTNGNPVTAPKKTNSNSNKDLGDRDKARLAQLKDSLTALEKRRIEYQRTMAINEPESITYKEAEQVIAEIDREIAGIRAKQDEILGNTTPAQNMQKTPVSSDVKPQAQNHTPFMALEPASADKTPTVASPDVPASTDVAPSATQQTQGTQKERLSMRDLPQEAFYDPERDKNIKSENIVTPQQFAKIVEAIMNKYPQVSHLAPITIAYQLYKRQGLRIKV